uniref:Replication stress response regulator SDE2 n=1 Tax=Steinernema glaseri TaxID=37863 RepID=A0A1I8A5X1_9BILA
MADLKTEFVLSDSGAINALLQLPQELYYVTCGGKVVQDWENLPEEAHVHVHFRLRGGKGGFGSLLRSFRIHKSTNQLMCRDLNGRRIADVKEEERLRKWIAKAAEREKRKALKKKEKYERLKAGPAKHEFNDPKFKEAHDSVDSRTEDALEAGLEELKKAAGKEKKPVVEKAETSDSDSDGDGFDVPGPSWLIKKRKRKLQDATLSMKKPKMIEEVAKENVPSDDKAKVEEKVDPKPEEVVEAPKQEPVKCVEEKPQKEAVQPPKVFERINLDEMEDVESLEALGLDHLKFELESRNLKCGGNLSERAKRLFSVKGLTPDKYPKNVKAAPKKK